jgi:hypothetical protein
MSLWPHPDEPDRRLALADWLVGSSIQASSGPSALVDEIGDGQVRPVAIEPAEPEVFDEGGAKCFTILGRRPE